MPYRIIKDVRDAGDGAVYLILSADLPFFSSARMRAEDGVIRVDQSRCVGCLTCVLVCPYGALAPNEDGVMQKCELCLQNACGEPACVAGCPNQAIVYEEREELP